MLINKKISLISGIILLIVCKIYAEDKVQYIYLDNETINTNIEKTFTISAMYDVSDGDNTLIGIGIRVHYDSSQFDLIDFSNYYTSPAGNPLTRNESSFENDGDNNTDKVLIIAWSSLFNPEWPGDNLPLELIQLKFKVKKNAEIGQSKINVTYSSKDINYQVKTKGSIVNIYYNGDYNRNGKVDIGDVFCLMKKLALK